MPLHETMNFVKPILCRRPKDVGNANSEIPSKKTCGLSMDSAQEEKHVADKMTENSWRSGEYFQIKRKDEEFGVYPACIFFFNLV